MLASLASVAYPSRGHQEWSINSQVEQVSLLLLTIPHHGYSHSLHILGVVRVSHLVPASPIWDSGGYFAAQSVYLRLLIEAPGIAGAALRLPFPPSLPGLQRTCVSASAAPLPWLITVDLSAQGQNPKAERTKGRGR